MDFGGPIVAKFGGSSLADADRFRHVWKIITSDPKRRYIVVSAPGGMTNDLIQLSKYAEAVKQPPEFNTLLDAVSRRVVTLGRELGVTIGEEIAEEIRERATNYEGPDALWSRGEWASARLMAAYGGCGFADATHFIKLREDRRIDPITFQLIQLRLETTGIWIIGGFYGLGPHGLRVFRRGGSDLSGSEVAVGVHASVYENWTDVPGIYPADPNYAQVDEVIPALRYPTARELTYGGARVLHRDAVAPVARAGIPLHIRSTQHPERDGTWLLPALDEIPQQPVIGIAGREQLITFVISEIGLDEKVGLGDEIFRVFSDLKVPFEHTMTGIDSFAVTAKAEEIEGHVDEIRRLLKTLHGLEGPAVDVIRGGALICIVGENLHDHRRNVIGDVVDVLKVLDVPLESITAVPRGRSVIVGVPHEKLPIVTAALHERLVKGVEIKTITMHMQRATAASPGVRLSTPG
jgi:aspartate kinase